MILGVPRLAQQLQQLREGAPRVCTDQLGPGLRGQRTRDQKSGGPAARGVSQPARVGEWSDLAGLRLGELGDSVDDERGIAADLGPEPRGELPQAQAGHHFLLSARMTSLVMSTWRGAQSTAALLKT